MCVGLFVSRAQSSGNPLHTDRRQKELYNVHVDYQIEALTRLRGALDLRRVDEVVAKLAATRFEPEELSEPEDK